MRKALSAAVTSAIALVSISVAYSRADPVSDQCNQYAGNMTAWSTCEQNVCAQMSGGSPSERQQAQDECIINAHYPTGAPATRPVQTPQAPPTQAPPQVNQPATPQPAVVRPPKGLGASPQAIAAAKSNRSGPFEPSNPPKPPDQVDFSQRVQNVVNSHSRNVDVINGQVHPRHWDYIDHDQDGHPVIYNPMDTGTTFRYYYQGDYRDAYVEAGSSVSFSFSDTGVFPFTAVGGDYLTTGSFYAGVAPALYQDVAAYIPAYNQTVQVGKVQPMGHDDSQPAGSQDTFMLDDSTLAWGQATNPSDGGQITVTKTQTLPGVGPTDDGKSLIDLAAVSHPQPTHTWWPWLLGGGVLVIAVGLVAWVATRRKRSADLEVSG
jgi:hypothetical protein